jgi:hypothetical protein
MPHRNVQTGKASKHATKEFYLKQPIYRSALAAALSLAALSAHAADANDKNVHFLLKAGLTGGGDTITTIEYTDGTSDSIKAGGLVQLGGGVSWQSPELPVAVQLTANYQVTDSRAAKNGSAKFSRFPIEATVYYTGVQQWRFGAGVRSDLSPEYSGHIDGVYSESMKFKNATGAIVEAGYSFAPRQWVNVRYVSEKLKATSYTNNGMSFNTNNLGKVDGSHFGVFYQFEF